MGDGKVKLPEDMVECKWGDRRRRMKKKTEGEAEGGGGKGTTSDQSTLEVLERAAWVEVQRLEHVRRHDRRRPEGDGRVDERLLQEACEGVADELRRE